jgi:hypothetical protein
MAVVGALFSLLRSKPVRPAATEAADGFAAHEAEVKAELSDAQPLSPATGVAEPLDEGQSAGRGASR